VPEFIPIDRTEFVPGDEEPILLGADRALCDRVYGGGVGQTGDAVVCGRVRTDVEVIVTMLAFGHLERDGGLVVGRIRNGVGHQPGLLYDGFVSS
jgi:hypothetical protein